MVIVKRRIKIAIKLAFVYLTFVFTALSYAIVHKLNDKSMKYSPTTHDGQDNRIRQQIGSSFYRLYEIISGNLRHFPNADAEEILFTEHEEGGCTVEHNCNVEEFEHFVLQIF